MLQAKVNQLKTKLADCYIVDASSMPKDVVNFGSIVTVKDVSDGLEEQYILVGPGEEDYNSEPMKILTNSPIAQGLIGKKVGDQTEVEIPAGKVTFEIVAIDFEERIEGYHETHERTMKNRKVFRGFMQFSSGVEHRWLRSPFSLQECPAVRFALLVFRWLVLCLRVQSSGRELAAVSRSGWARAFLGRQSAHRMERHQKRPMADADSRRGLVVAGGVGRIGSF